MMAERPFDLRGVPVWRRADEVLERADALDAGQALEWMMELDPRALVARLDVLRPGELAFASRRIGASEWHVTLTRLAEEDESSALLRALRRSETFRSLRPSTLDALAGSVTEHARRKAEIVFEENAERASLGILVEGALAIFGGAGNREQLLAHVFPFDVFGDVEFFDAGRSVGRTVVVSKAARYGLIPYEAIRALGIEEPALLLALGSRCAQRTRTLASALATQTSMSILARVALALLPYAAPARDLEPALAPLPQMTQAQVAAAAGTVKEVAARAIADLERAGALRRERGHIRFLNRAKLLQYIGG